MIHYNYYHVDAFTDKLFSGNPAAVCVLTEPLSEQCMKKIAIENQLPVTAFIKLEGDVFHIRWITPESELPLCGHGTMAAAWVLFHELKVDTDTLQFHSSKAGNFTVQRKEHFIELNFPVKTIKTISHIPDALKKGLSVDILEVYESDDRVLVLIASEMLLKTLSPDFDILKSLPYRGVIVSAPGDTVDFVSRTFYPHKQIPEDAVTGASHCVLMPYWVKRLGKATCHVYQVSERGGELFCTLSDDRVLLKGSAVTYLRGNLFHV